MGDYFTREWWRESGELRSNYSDSGVVANDLMDTVLEYGYVYFSISQSLNLNLSVNFMK